ncbi:hypothetical protein PaG_04938 [Moesziomyces aphidis]|uniref:Uncharacterized protein n=1 Tax=Moesziomyces aphidis TaxID=84754 RepID=W3VHF8_MOEAP|nr:hypothetical protein PaG_04938 [Moesziomyces aphidis]
MFRGINVDRLELEREEEEEKEEEEEEVGSDASYAEWKWVDSPWRPSGPAAAQHDPRAAFERASRGQTEPVNKKLHSLHQQRLVCLVFFERLDAVPSKAGGGCRLFCSPSGRRLVSWLSAPSSKQTEAGVGDPEGLTSDLQRDAGSTAAAA